MAVQIGMKQAFFQYCLNITSFMLLSVCKYNIDISDILVKGTFQRRFEKFVSVKAGCKGI